MTTPTPGATDEPSRKETRLRYPLIWIAFLTIICTGAGMLLSKDADTQTWGVVLIASPIAIFGILGGAYYLLERFRSS